MYIVILCVATIPMLIMGIVILVGKGDNLIAGYNAASKEEKSKYNIKRLRGLVGGLLTILAPMTVILLGLEMRTTTLLYQILIFIMCIVVVVLANTWGKKKSK